MKLTTEKLKQIIKEEVERAQGSNKYEGMINSGDEATNELRDAIMKFVKDSSQLDDPQATIISIVEELLDSGPMK